ncbi:MAG: flagellar basal body rod protein FlgB [Clostridia bacterium]|nr:flagellar basal body rod protein FlgB [Clostridia bacterium]
MITNSGSMDIMAKALDAYTLRNSTIASNIANDDTPGYKRKEVKFEDSLNKAINETQTNTNHMVANRNIKSRIANQNQLKAGSVIDNVKAEVVEQETDSMYRIDGNNVDIDNEMNELVKNQLRYSTVLSQINKQFQAMRTAMGK